MPPPERRTRALLEALEPRILYSADLAAVATMTGGEAVLAHEVRLQSPASVTAAAVEANAAAFAEIAFVDLGVPDAQALISGLQAQRAAGRPIEVVTLAADEDGLAVISQTLAERQAQGASFDAVHVFSHGQAGGVQLGIATLDADSLLRRAGEIAVWGGALSAQADLMLYGCDVAADASGLFLIEGLAALTGADVAASEDLTGHAARGGDWVLEQHTGTIESAVAVDAALQQVWDGVLGNEIQVNTTTSGQQSTNAETRGSQQAVAMDAAGNFVVAWTSKSQDGDGQGVYVRRFAFDGTALTAEIQVNTTTAKDQQNARIVSDAAGNFAVVWSSTDQDGTPSSVYLRRFAANGSALTGEIRANATSTGPQSNAVIGMNTTDGTVVVAWEGEGPGAGSVYFRRFALDGTALDVADRAVSSVGGEANAAVAMDATGRFVVAWDRGHHLYFQRYDAAGMVAGTQTQVDNLLSNSIGAAIAMDSAGNFALAYREQDTVPGVWGRAFNANGSARDLWFYADTGDLTASGDATSPSISLAADGSAVVVYQRTGDGDKMGIYARKISASGSVQGAVFLVNQSTAKDQVSASVAVHDTNHFVVVWSGDSTADKDGVYARTFAPASVAPLITTNGGGGTAAVSVAENTTAVTTVGANGFDWPLQTAVYSIVGGADQSQFALDAQSGALRFVAAPDFERPADIGADNVYDVTVQASNGLVGTTQALAVTVTGVNDQVPVIVSDGGGLSAVLNVAENSTAVTVVSATDADVPTPTLSYSIAGGTDQALFSIDSQSGAVAFLTAPDFEHPTSAGGGNAYEVTVQASDGVHADVQTLRVQVTDANEYRVGPLTDLDASLDAVDENVAIGTVVGLTVHAVDADGSDNTVAYALDASAGGLFAIDRVSGVVKVAGLLNAEVATSHGLIVRATSADGSSLTHAYTIAVRDLDEFDVTVPADANSAANTVREDANVGDTVGLTVTATDADTTRNAVTYSLTNSAGGRFAIRASSGVVTVARALDAETAMSHTLVVQATSADGSVSSQTFTIAVQDVNESDIGWIQDVDAADETVREDAVIGTPVGLQARAIDADATNHTVTYSLFYSTGGRFAINANNGIVTVAGALDAESTWYWPGIAVGVRATSSDGSFSTSWVSISVQDVDEFDVTAPVDGNTAANVITNTASVGTAVGITASASDEDVSLNQISYTLANDAGGRFAVQASSGVVTLARSIASDADSVQNIVLQATSADGSVSTKNFSIVITQSNLYTPVINSDGGGDTAALTVLENTTAVTTVIATDADRPQAALTYVITGGADAARFTIDAVSGVLRFLSPPDAERPLDSGGDNVHEVIVQASDGLRLDTQTLTVTVADVNEVDVTLPVDADAAADGVQENAAIGTRVGVTASAIDADATNHDVTYTLDDSAGGRFAIDAGTGVVTVAGLLDAETALSHTFVVRASSSDGSTTTRTWSVAVQDVDEFDVSAVTDTDARADSVREDAPTGTAVDLTAWAIDRDATSSAVRYALTDDAGGRFAIDAVTGVVTTAQALDAEAALSHTLVVQATSADGSAQSLQVTVAVQDVDEFDLTALTDADASADSVSEDAAIGTRVGVAASAIDADATNHGVTYTLDDSAGGRFAIDAVTGVVTTAQALDAEAALSHTLVVQATSADGSAQSLRVTVAVQDVDEFDLAALTDADASADLVSEDAAIGTRIGVTASAIDADATNHGVTYTLDDSAGGRFAIDAGTGVVTVAGLLDAETALSHTFVVRATSSDGSTTTRTWSVAVQDVNEFDVSAVSDADARADSVREDAAIGTTVGLTVLAIDPDATSNAVRYALTDDAGGRFAIDAVTGVVTTAQALDAEAALSHTLVVQATSADGSVQPLRVTVAVQDVNEFDVSAVSDTDARADSVREDAAIGTAVGLTAWAIDPDATSSAVRYTLIDDAGGRFVIDAVTGVVTTTQVLDAEIALNHTLVVQATSADGSAQSLQVTVAVQDVDEFDLTALTDADASADSVSEDAAIGTQVGVTASAIDADATNHGVTYTLDDSAGGRFAIDAGTGVVTVAGLLDAETVLSHTFVVRATSSDGSTTMRTWSVAVQDVNEFDVSAVSDADARADSVREDAPIGTAVGLTAWAIDSDATSSAVRYALTDDAGGRFAIDAVTGVVSTAQALDAEVALSHTLVVQATSADGSAQSLQVTVTVQDVDEFDLAALTDADASADSVSEDAAIGTRVGVTASAIDADATNHGVTYTLDDSAGGRFAVDALTGAVTLARSVQEEGVASRTLVLRATAADGSTVTSGFTIAIEAVNDVAPEIESNGGGANAAVSVMEGQALVTQVIARDADLPTPTLRYTISGGVDAAAFTLEATSGVLRFVSAPDAEAPGDGGADNVYEVTVQVSDGQYTDEQALRITVQPVNDHAPVITTDGGGATALRHIAENTTLATQVQANDPDLPADTLTYGLAGGADAALFSIDAATGVLRWRAAPDHEAPLDVGADQHYEVVVSVSDGLHVASQALTLVVDNVDEAPRLDSSSLTVREGDAARPVLVATDVDTPAARLVYRVQDLSGGWFESTQTPGVAITRFTQAEVEADMVRFITDGGERAPAYRLVLADDTSVLAPQAAAVAFTPVNDAPVVPPVDLGTVDEDQSRLITASEWLAQAGDAEGDALSVSNLRLASGEGALVDLGGGRWRFDPRADWHGAVTLVGEVSDGAARVALSASLQVQAVNDAPHIVSQEGAATVALDCAENTLAVDTVQGADLEATVPLRYAVAGGADAALFHLDEVTGVLTFRQAPDHERPIDANGDGRYEVIVEVSDGDLRAQQALVVTVTNVDEAPVILRNTLLVSDGTVTLVLQASDPDTPATALTYVVDSVQGGQFERPGAPGKAVVQFTQADIDAAQVVWVAPAGSVRAAYGLRLSDGRSEVAVGAPTLQHQSSAAVEVMLTVQSLVAGDSATAPSAGEAAASATKVPLASVGRRAEPALAGMTAETSAEAGLGLAQGVAEEPVLSRSASARPGEGDSVAVRVPVARAAMAPVVERVEVALDLPSEGAETPKRLVTDLDLWSSRSGTSLAAQLDRLRHEVAEAQQAHTVSLASTALVSTGLSVGYVVWLVRGGVLMTSLMSAVPAWAGMDPLPVLAEMRRAESRRTGDDAISDDDDGGDDPIEKLFSKARRLLVRSADRPTTTPPEGSA